ncbi:MAG: type IV toxin-antitoxin system AbiEi family antitoxin domain-containing protein [Candidatus Omnitrophota bacterium]|nr:type IV toxin-antitoxin system AbiEi family antitoxin domain-containing protein [Candidatus Omnitrophota bacterium]
MVSKNTILTEKRLVDIEDIIVASGKIVTANDIHKALGRKYSKFVLKKRVYELKKNGWLIPLRRGLYFISDISSRGFVNISPVIIANAFNKDSYVSLDSALNHYGLFEQMLRTVSSVTNLKSKKYVFQKNTYRYLKINKKLYFGFKTENIEGYYVKVAELEKVILDYLYFKNDTYSIDLLLEKLQKAKDRINFRRLFTYARKFPEAARRKLGFILDILKIDTEELRKTVGAKGYSKLTPNSKKFNAKWRLYYEDRFVG